MTPALEVIGPEQALRRPAGDARRVAHRDAGRAAPDHRAERRRQDHAVQPDHRRPHARRRLGQAVRAGAAEDRRRSSACISASRAPTRSSRCFPKETLVPQRRAGAARPRQDALEPVDASRPVSRSFTTPRAKRWPWSASATSRDRTVAETSYGERRRLEMAMALAQKPKVLLLDEPLAGLSQEERSQVRELLAQSAARRHHRDDRARHGFGARLRGAHHAAALRRGDRRGHARRSGRRSAHQGGVPWRVRRSSIRDVDAYYGDSHVLHGVGFALRSRQAARRCSAATAPARPPAWRPSWASCAPRRGAIDAVRRAGRRARARGDRAQGHLPGAAGPPRVPLAHGAREPDGRGADAREAATPGRSTACSRCSRG